MRGTSEIGALCRKKCGRAFARVVRAASGFGAGRDYVDAEQRLTQTHHVGAEADSLGVDNGCSRRRARCLVAVLKVRGDARAA